VQVPPHWPLDAVHTPLAQATEVPQLPVASQVWTPTPAESHWVACGAQEPTQVPLTQAWLVQAVPAPQLPLALHVWTLLPAAVHCVAPGLQEPTQVPGETQAWLPQSWAAPHCPLALHVSTPLLTHWVALGVHTGPASAIASSAESLPVESSPDSVVPSSPLAVSAIVSTVESCGASSAIEPSPPTPESSLATEPSFGLPCVDVLEPHAEANMPSRRLTDAKRTTRPELMCFPSIEQRRGLGAAPPATMGRGADASPRASCHLWVPWTMK
jgi:hypothetical protein